MAVRSDRAQFYSSELSSLERRSDSVVTFLAARKEVISADIEKILQNAVHPRKRGRNGPLPFF